MIFEIWGLIKLHIFYGLSCSNLICLECVVTKMYVKYLKLTIDCSRFTLDWYLHEFISLRLITDLLILKVVLIHVMWPLEGSWLDFELIINIYVCIYNILHIFVYLYVIHVNRSLTNNVLFFFLAAVGFAYETPPPTISSIMSFLMKFLCDLEIRFTHR